MALSYADLLACFATMPTLDAWYWSVDTDRFEAMIAAVGDAKTRRRADQAIARAHAHDNLQAVNKLTAVVDGHRRIVDQLPLVGHVAGDDEPDRMQSLLDGYRASLPEDVRQLMDRFKLVDAARKVVGVGSVGTRCWIALLEGGGDDDPLILQIKEAQASVLEAHLGRPAYRNHARRVVEGQRLMQAASDLFLGWTHDETSGVDYYWRNLRDMKASADVNAQPTNTFMAYADLCGATLARAHARSGDAAAISGYLGKGDVFGKRSAASRSRMPIRMHVTTRRSSRRSKTAGCRRSPTCDATRHGSRACVARLGHAPLVPQSHDVPVGVDDLGAISQGVSRGGCTKAAPPCRMRWYSASTSSTSK